MVWESLPAHWMKVITMNKWGERLFDCIHAMAIQKTNPVLLILEGAEAIHAYQHYPDPSLGFVDNKWRVYYHCHPSPNNDKNEHGHFHFFSKLPGKSDWAHVVGLGIDTQGQPVRIFTTNKWVTGGDWLLKDELPRCFDVLKIAKNGTLLERWFTNFLLFYQPRIQSLYRDRDTAVQTYFPKESEEGFCDHDVYYLSMISIDLKTELSAGISPPGQPGQAMGSRLQA